MIDLDRVRADTPGVAHVAHLNNAGSSLPPRQVLDAVVDHLRREAEIGGYEAAHERRDRWEHAYDALARLLNARRDEVAVVENATRAWDMAFYAFPFNAGDRILTARAEYSSNYIAYLQVAKRTGAVVEAIPNDEHGQISIAALRDMIDERVRLISITHVPTQGGLVNPAVEAGVVAREAGILYLLDACQSVGQMPMDVKKIGCDMLSATGRKYLRGPRGTGFLYVRRELIQQLEPPFLDLHAATWVADDRYEIRNDSRRFENWEMYYAGKVGLGVAIDYALGWDVQTTWPRIKKLAEQLRSQLLALGFVTIHDLGLERCGIVTFNVEGIAADEVQRKLLDMGINVSVSLQESGRLDLAERKIPQLVRASVHYYNSEDEMERFCDAVARVFTKRGA